MGDYEPDPPVPPTLRPHRYSGVSTTCKICPKPYYSRGFCVSHYFNWYQCGHPLGARYVAQQKLLAIPEAPRKGNWCKWTKQEIDEVLELRRKGWTRRMISRKTGRSVYSISSLLYRRSLEFENG